MSLWRGMVHGLQFYFCILQGKDRKLEYYVPFIFLHQKLVIESLSPYKRLCITKTYLYNFDPLNPNFYIVKLGFTGCALFFLVLLKNIDCRYLLEPPRRGGTNRHGEAVLASTLNLCFEQKCEKKKKKKKKKKSEFLSENFQDLVVKFSIYFNMLVFVMRLALCANAYESQRVKIYLTCDV